MTIEPETPLERQIMEDPDWQAGAAWGFPRPGHPEGRVAEHIRELLARIDELDVDPDERSRLRLVALIHDTFKNQVDRSQPRTGDNHHARLARRFAERHVEDPGVLDVIEQHDDGYRMWSRARRTGDWDRAAREAAALRQRLGDDLDLFMRFYRADNATGDKRPDDYLWFEDVSAADNRSSARALPARSQARSSGPSARS